MSGGYTKFPNDILDALLDPCFELNDTERKIILFGVRQTIGFQNRHAVKITRRELADKIGVKKAAVNRSFKSLASKNVVKIYSTRRSEPTRFGVNKDVSKWESLGSLEIPRNDKPLGSLEIPRNDVKRSQEGIPRDPSLGSLEIPSDPSETSLKPHNQADKEVLEKVPKETLKERSLKKVFKQSREDPEKEVLKPFETCVSVEKEGTKPKDPRSLVAGLIKVQFDHLFEDREFDKASSDLAIEKLGEYVQSQTRKKPYTWNDRLGALLMAVQEFKSTKADEAILYPWPYVLKMASSHLDYAAHVNLFNKRELGHGSASGEVLRLEYDWRLSNRATEQNKNLQAKERYLAPVPAMRNHRTGGAELQKVAFKL